MQHYIDIGRNDKTIVYEIVLKRIAEIPSGTPLMDIVGKLKSNGINNVLVDDFPESINFIREHGLIAQRAILKTPKE